MLIEGSGWKVAAAAVLNEGRKMKGQGHTAAVKEG